MDLHRRRALVSLLGLAGAARAARAAGDLPGYETVSWPALLPPGWSAQAVLGGLRLENMDDNDPEAEEVLRKVRALLDSAPPNPQVHNRRLRLSGYMVPLQFTKQRHVTELLLVPYFGACIHSPAPPANQVVHVLPAQPVDLDTRSSIAVWVAGSMSVVRSDSDMGAACYRMSAAEVRPYKA